MPSPQTETIILSLRQQTLLKQIVRRFLIWFQPSDSRESTSLNIPRGSIRLNVGASILMRRLLKQGNFTSTQDLKQKILDFITYYNRTFAKPFQWKFEGFTDAV